MCYYIKLYVLQLYDIYETWQQTVICLSSWIMAMEAIDFVQWRTLIKYSLITSKLNKTNGANSKTISLSMNEEIQ